MSRIVEEFYGRPQRAVPALMALAVIAVAWLTNSPACTAATALILWATWNYWSARVVIDDLRLGPVTLDCPQLSDQSQPLVWLTFDDGPGEQTLEIVRLLNQAGRPSTFFFIGQRVSNFEGLKELREALKKGRHSVANHTLHHSNLLKLSASEMEREIVANQELLCHHFPDSVVPLFRPPYGYRNARTLAISSQQGLEVVGWSLNSLDFLGGSPDRVAERVKFGLRAGVIVLFHDGGGDRKRTAAALPSILDQLESRGFGAYTPR